MAANQHTPALYTAAEGHRDPEGEKTLAGMLARSPKDPVHP